MSPQTRSTLKLEYQLFSEREDVRNLRFALNPGSGRLMFKYEGRSHVRNDRGSSALADHQIRPGPDLTVIRYQPVHATGDGRFMSREIRMEMPNGACVIEGDDYDHMPRLIRSSREVEKLLEKGRSSLWVEIPSE